MDIIIMLVISFLFMYLFFQKSYLQNKGVFWLWLVAIALVMILFKLHVTTPLHYSF